jgi:hypothetical protein
MIRNRTMRSVIVLCMISLAIFIILALFGNKSDLIRVPTRFISFISSSKNMRRVRPFTCRIHGQQWIIVTTIFYPTSAIYKFLNLSTPWNLVVVADKKTPHDWLQHLTVNTSNIVFVGIEEQSTLNYHILDFLPYGSYARKNIGYLIAIQCGATVIFESDDDNLLESNEIYRLPKIVKPNDVPWEAFHRQRSPFVNIYGSFGHPQIWPRGFPVDELLNVTEDGWHTVRKNTHPAMPAYIQQYLADLDPDVDALVMLTFR